MPQLHKSAIPGFVLLLSYAVRGLALQPPPLHVDVFTSDESSYFVTSTIISGATEALLVDAQMNNSQAAKLAERIAHSGKRLKAIFITHPDLDHYMGLTVIHDRFPDAPIYMTDAALAEFKRSSADNVARRKKSAPAETPDSLPTPQAVRTTDFSVDGQSILVIKDLQGDVLEPANSFMWIPSLRAVIAGDIVFDGIHPWLADSSATTRAAWLQSLDFIRALRPSMVVPGHLRQAEARGAKGIDFMRRYLRDFEAARRISRNADELVNAMTRRYPGLAWNKFLQFAAKAAFAGANQP